ncbi:MAG: (2Fe-2S)-binding protein [Acidobacteria bacterium]|nr:(2Fe-2S)-binding protein [Acidobacteriota bacterium]
MGIISGSLEQLLNFTIDERVEYAETLPSFCYTDPRFLSVEEERVFGGSWQLVGRIDQLPLPGSYITAQLGPEPVVLLRGSDGMVRGFINVCRHRAGPVATGAGRCERLRCGYHGWTYDLNGKLIGLPDFEGAVGLDRDEVTLHPIETAIWEQFIFARLRRQLRRQSPSLPEMLGDIPAAVAGWDVASLRFAGRRDYEIKCNWKVYVDNYVEGYHVPIIHPSLMREIDYRRYRTVTGRFHSRQDAPIRTDDDRSRRYAADERSGEALYFWIFPNLMLNIYPDNLSTNLIVPLGPDRTLTIFEWYFNDIESDEGRAKIAATIDLSDEIQREDIAICEAVQARLHSSFYHRGRYSPVMENGLHHFHSLWLEWMREE